MHHVEQALRSVLERAVGTAATFVEGRPGTAGRGGARVPQNVAPGAAAVAGTASARTPVVVAGVRKGTPPGAEGPPAVTADTRFDLASLTKVVATLPSILTLVTDAEIELDDPVRRFFGNAGWFQEPTLADATVRDLLGHTSGLPAWKPVFAQTDARLTAVANVLQTELEAVPGVKITYSDLGYITLGAIVERVCDVRLDAFAAERVFAPLGLDTLAFRPLERNGVPAGPDVGPRAEAGAAPAFAATEDCGWRGMLLEGVVHDENAWIMGGVAGHAGLFGAADDLATYAQAWLRTVAGTRDDGPSLPFAASLAREAVREHARTPDVRRGLGWQLASSESPAGERAGPRSFGHTGFTGTSMWIDPDAGWFAVLLTNRVHPSRARGAQIGLLRAAYHDEVARAMAPETGAPGADAA